MLLTHLATAYLTPPPPLSTPEKFWGVFIPFSERAYESEKLVFGPNGEGGGGIVKGELVVEVLVRGGGEGRRRTVERVLEGWADTKGGPCELSAMESLKSIWTKKAVAEEVGTFKLPFPELRELMITTIFQAPPDPTQNVSFNLNLTDSQQQSRAQVPLPYAHEGQLTHNCIAMTNSNTLPQGNHWTTKQHPLLFFTTPTQRMTLTTMTQTKIWIFEWKFKYECCQIRFVFICAAPSTMVIRNFESFRAPEKIEWLGYIYYLTVYSITIQVAVVKGMVL